jgi:hypothetical protein
MRSAINENRTVQLALLALLALAGGFLLLKVTKGSGSQAAAPAAASTATTGSTATATGAAPADPASADPAVAGASTVTSTSGSPTAVPASMVPGGGAPKDLLKAYQRGNGVAVLVVRDGGTDDALVRRSSAKLDAIPRLSVFVTRAKGIARFAWLTQGVDVTELPALVVLQPRRISHGAPTASVSYGFRNGASVIQAAKDGLYKGPTDLPYHP